ncbi:30111_t:CDS:2, partial [Gigaspora margarita]
VECSNCGENMISENFEVKHFEEDEERTVLEEKMEDERGRLRKCKSELPAWLKWDLVTFQNFHSKKISIKKNLENVEPF